MVYMAKTCWVQTLYPTLQWWYTGNMPSRDEMLFQCTGSASQTTTPRAAECDGQCSDGMGFIIPCSLTDGLKTGVPEVTLTMQPPDFVQFSSSGWVSHAIVNARGRISIAKVIASLLHTSSTEIPFSDWPQGFVMTDNNVLLADERNKIVLYRVQMTNPICS